MKVAIQDFKTSWKEIKQKSYHWHWIGGLITTLLIYLITTFPNAYLFAFLLNIVIWGVKEMVWGFMEYLTRNGKRPYLKFLAWSEPDWKDWRFSIYGGIPITGLIYLLTNKKQ